jgi:protein-S-isoprenylcysteine O-methyltransferase Ste14
MPGPFAQNRAASEEVISVEFTFLRLYLLSGLLLHKLVWEILKSKDDKAAQGNQATPAVRVLSGLKVLILLGIIIQTLLAPVFPIAAGDARGLQWVGCAAFTLGLAIAVSARMQLGRNWSNIENSYTKKDHALVTAGIYRYVRHPIYLGDLLLVLGLELALNSWLVVGVLLLAAYIHRRTRGEERKLLVALPGYAEYCRRTTRFLPFIPI